MTAASNIDIDCSPNVLHRLHGPKTAHLALIFLLFLVLFPNASAFALPACKLILHTYFTLIINAPASTSITSSTSSTIAPSTTSNMSSSSHSSSQTTIVTSSSPSSSINSSNPLPTTTPSSFSSSSAALSSSSSVVLSIVTGTAAPSFSTPPTSSSSPNSQIPTSSVISIIPVATTTTTISSSTTTATLTTDTVTPTEISATSRTVTRTPRTRSQSPSITSTSTITTSAPAVATAVTTQATASASETYLQITAADGSIIIVTSFVTSLTRPNSYSGSIPSSSSGTKALSGQSHSSSGFFSNTGAVAGTFAVVGLAAAGFLIGLAFFFCRRKRARQLDEDIRVAAGGAGDGGAGINRFGHDEEEEDHFDDSAPQRALMNEVFYSPQPLSPVYDRRSSALAAIVAAGAVSSRTGGEDVQQSRRRSTLSASHGDDLLADRTYYGYNTHLSPFANPVDASIDDAYPDWAHYVDPHVESQDSPDGAYKGRRSGSGESSDERLSPDYLGSSHGHSPIIDHVGWTQGIDSVPRRGLDDHSDSRNAVLRNNQRPSETLTQDEKNSSGRILRVANPSDES